MSDKLKIHTFAVTFRPLDGVTDDDVDKLTTWVKRKSDYYHIVTEKTGTERHVHAAVFLKDPMVHSNFSTLLVFLFKRLDATEKRVFRTGIKPMYNYDWVTNYLDKDDDTVVIASCLPESLYLESIFPVQKKRGQKNSKNPYYDELETLWYTHVETHREINTVNARHFLFKMMYSERSIKILRDDKCIIQTARHLVRYLKRTDESTIALPPFEEEE